MAISGNVLGFISGAAEQFTKNKETFKQELRDNKRKQKEWLNTYGNKALEETKLQQESVELALDELEARGLKTPDALQLLQRHGVNAVLELNKTVKDYESANSTTVDADLMNKIWKAAEDFTPTSQSFEEAVSKVFGTNKAGSTAPVIQESEERGFFDKIKANLSGAYEDEEYDDFLSDPSEGMGGYTINELRAMSASSLSMVGSDGAAVFDRSALRGSDSSPSDRDQWKTVRSDIVLNAVRSLTEEESREITTNTAGDSYTARSTQDQFALLKINHPEVLAEATRKVGGGLSENPAAWTAYGGQDALNAILNPLTLEQELENRELNREDLKAFDTVAEVTTYFAENPNVEFAIVGDEFAINKNYNPAAPTETVDEPSDDPTVDQPELPVEEGAYNTDDLTLKVQPSEGVIEARPPNFVESARQLLTLTEEEFDKLNKNKKDQRGWDAKYGGKYNYDGTYMLVRPQGPPPEDINSRERYEYDLWDAKYGDTHDPRTGYPLIEGLDKTLIPNSGVAN